MIWMVVSVLGVLLMGASVLGVFLVVSPGVRMFCLGAVCTLGVVGVLFALAPQYTMPEKTRERQASARSREEAPGAGPEAAASGEQRSGPPGAPAAPTAPARHEAVSTPAEAAQAVQRLRAAHDARADAPPAPALLPPRGTPIPRVTVLPPASLPPREAASPAVAPPPAETAAPPAPTVGRGRKGCDELKAEIQAKFEANHIMDASLTIIASGALPGHHIVGSCEGGTKQIVLHRTQGGP